MSQEDYTGEKQKPMQHTGSHRVPEISTEASIAKAEGVNSL